MDNPGSLKFNERAVLTRLRQMSVADFEQLPDCGEGLAVRLHEAARRAVRLEEIYDLAKTKRYAHARIRRGVLWAALGLKESDRPDIPPYLRVLAANERGRAVLKALPEGVTVITKPAHGRGLPLLELEARCTDFYALCRERILPCGAEWTTSPIMI
jgi:predicted nucleotidyltransferase